MRYRRLGPITAQAVHNHGIGKLVTRGWVSCPCLVARFDYGHEVAVLGNRLARWLDRRDHSPQQSIIRDRTAPPGPSRSARSVWLTSPVISGMGIAWLRGPFALRGAGRCPEATAC